MFNMSREIMIKDAVAKINHKSAKQKFQNIEHWVFDNLETAALNFAKGYSEFVFPNIFENDLHLISYTINHLINNGWDAKNINGCLDRNKIINTIIIYK
jgi:hypothetical protein